MSTQPKTLTEAIQRGLVAACRGRLMSRDEQLKTIRASIQDFINQDQIEISRVIDLFLHAWGQGDDHEIQKVVVLMSDWAKRRDDRLTEQNFKKRAA